MKIKRFRNEKAIGPRGFSQWVQPRMAKYLLACCDCGLVHEMQFRVSAGAVGKNRDSGQLMHVQFRARRANGYTTQLRKPKRKPK